MVRSGTRSAFVLELQRILQYENGLVARINEYKFHKRTWAIMGCLMTVLKTGQKYMATVKNLGHAEKRLSLGDYRIEVVDRGWHGRCVNFYRPKRGIRCLSVLS